MIINDILVELIPTSGGWLCCAMIDDQFVKRRYFGYTKAEARAEFIAENTTNRRKPQGTQSC